MGSGAACKCGRRLSLATEVASGKCWACKPRVENVVILADEPVVSLGSVTPDSVALPVESSVTGSVTKQEKYRAKNPEKTKADSAARVAKWRDGQRRRRAE